MRPARPSARRDCRGVALLTVLLLVAVMAILVTGMLDDIRFGIRRAGNAQAMAQARWHALGAEEVARHQVARIGSGGARIPVAEWNGRPLVFPVEHGMVQARLSDATTCFNVNSVVEGAPGLWQRRDAGAAQFGALLRVLGFPDVEAVALTDALVDWIDADQSSGMHGAEDGAYAPRREGYRTAGALLAEPSELRAIEGFDARVYERLRPHVCALPDDAPAPVNINALDESDDALLAALTGLERTAAGRLLRNRPAGGWADVDAFWSQPAFAPGQPPAAVRKRFRLDSRYFALETRVDYAGAQFASSALIEADGGHARIVARRWTLPE